MEQGREIGSLAQSLFPDGEHAAAANGATTDVRTEELVADGDVRAVFEARFEWQQTVARADILERLDDGWHVLEVKSSFSDTTSMRDLIGDLAYTVMVATGTGLPVVRPSLVLLSRGYRNGDPPESLFEVVDVTDKVLARAAEFTAGHDQLVAAVLGDARPEPTLKSACRACSYFESKCLGAGIAHTVLELPGLHHTKLKTLSSRSVIAIDAVPDDIQLNDVQERVRLSAVSGEPAVTSDLGAALNGIEWPCHYLDFESVATVLPLYPGLACHAQVLTQFSVHRRAQPGGSVEHFDYLADPSRDCQRELAERLIECLGADGSVLVYSHFEKVRIKQLAATFPDFEGPLSRILDRLYDLLPTIKSGVYHPDFKGSFSIKAVLQPLVGNEGYAALEIADGDSAITRFARMARGEITGAEAERSRSALLQYCKTDTLAMVQLHDALLKLQVRE